MGEFSTGTMEQVQADIENAEASDKNRVPPTLTLPESGPESCLAHVNMKFRAVISVHYHLTGGKN